ncbi:hypothetical protein [Dactylosporangium sp. CA-139066]|uniref:hypothetical protein n=1 Tax=Dactylosporangium sp. CA-139066 TaxID=3239930 RepID=UPI003D939E54
MSNPPDSALDVPAAIAAILDVADEPDAAPPAILGALAMLRQVRLELDAAEPTLIEAARRAGVSWQAIAPALGVASRQAAERRYLRSAHATGRHDADTRDGRVQAERDRRAGLRAVDRWANDNTANLRRLAGQLAALPDLPTAAGDLERLHRALGDPDATALPLLLAAVRRHLSGHPEHADMADQIDAVTAATAEVRRTSQRHRESSRPATAP